MTRHAGLGAIQLEADVQGVRIADMAKEERGCQDSALGIPVRTSLGIKRGYSNRKIGKE